MNQRLPRGIRNNNPGNIRHGANWLGLNPNGRNIDSAFCVLRLQSMESERWQKFW